MLKLLILNFTLCFFLLFLCMVDQQYLSKAVTQNLQKRNKASVLRVITCLLPAGAIYIGGVMVSVLTLSCNSLVQTKDNKIGICCFSAKHTMLRRKSKDWLAQNQDNVQEWSRLLFQ